MKWTVVFALLALSIRPALAVGWPPTSFPDSWLTSKASLYFGSQAPVETRSCRPDAKSSVFLGFHNGVKVVAEGPVVACIPAAAEVIHYELTPGRKCRAAGGVSVKYTVDATGWRQPWAVSDKADGSVVKAQRVAKTYCVPAVLVKAKLDRPLQREPKAAPSDEVKVTIYK
jgi:hypothetical protein